jgi:protein-arginine kinase
LGDDALSTAGGYSFDPQFGYMTSLSQQHRHRHAGLRDADLRRAITNRISAVIQAVSSWPTVRACTAGPRRDRLSTNCPTKVTLGASEEDIGKTLVVARPGSRSGVRGAQPARSRSHGALTTG